MSDERGEHGACRGVYRGGESRDRCELPRSATQRRYLKHGNSAAVQRQRQRVHGGSLMDSRSHLGSCFVPGPSARLIFALPWSALKKAMNPAHVPALFFIQFNSFFNPISPSFLPRPSLPPSTFNSSPLSHFAFNPRCSTQGASMAAQVTVVSRHTDILVSSIISSSPSRFSTNTRASSSNTHRPLTQGLSHSPNPRPTPRPLSFNPPHPSSQPIALRARTLRIPA